MRKDHELFKQITRVLFLCTACTLLGGCLSFFLNPKTLEVNHTWIEEFARPNKTKDTDILHKLCKPTYIYQYSTGEKRYTYMEETGDLYSSATFTFNQNNTLKYLPESVHYVNYYGRMLNETKISSDLDLLVLLETLPSNPTKQQIRKKLGDPIMVDDNIITYSYDSWPAKYVSFSIKSNDLAEYMILPKSFFDYAKRLHAHFKVKTIYEIERDANEEEDTAIKQCEK